MQLVEHRPAAHYFIDFHAIGFRISKKLQLGAASRSFHDKIRQIKDGNLLVITDIHNFTISQRVRGQKIEGCYRVAHITKRTGLGSVTVNSDWQILHCLTNKSRHHHAVFSCLMTTDGVEKTCNNNFDSRLEHI